MRRTKYHSTKKVMYKNITFDSSLELYFYKLLEINKLESKVKMQVAFELQPSFKYFKQTIRKIDYVSDFYFEDKKIVVETKGLLEEKAKIKHKIFKHRYNDHLFFMPRNRADCETVIKEIIQIYGKE
jgi:hypothetical protein